MAIAMMCNRSKKLGGCGRRFTVTPYHIQEHEIKCPYCGSEKVYNVQKYRDKNLKQIRTDENACDCSAIGFPHIRGTMKRCRYNIDRRFLSPEDLAELQYKEIMRQRRKAKG